VRLPIRVRLTAWYIAVLAVITTAVGTFVVLQFRADMQAGIDRDVLRTWRSLAHEYGEEGLANYPEYSHSTLPRSGASQVYDSGGRLIAIWGRTAARGIIATPKQRAQALDGDSQLVTVSLGSDPESYRAKIGEVDRLGQRHVLAVAEPMQPVENSVERVVTLLLITIPAGLVAAALGGWWLARKALRPVGRMTSKAQHIGIDRLDERIAVPRAPDELSHLAATLNAMLDRLERGVAEQQRFIAYASHELRTPLTVMRAELDVNLRGDVAGPAREVLESTREEVDRMSRTVENLLTLASADEGELQLLTTPVDLRDAAVGAIRSLAPAATAKGLDLRAGDGRGHDGPVVVQADAHRVHQVLVNFIENAIKYTPPGGEVRVSAWRDGDEAGITVSDTGPGIPAEARDQVFDRFFRVDRARRRTSGGSGLGLAICLEIAEAHGGRVWVESEEGRGSAFSLALPASAAAEAARRGYQVRLRHRLKSADDEVSLREF
jgi:two-component system OmpR family sensor kinase